MISIDIPPSNNSYSLDRDELFSLRKKKIISTWQYVYFALQLQYSRTLFNVDIRLFCDAWEINEKEFFDAIAKITNKNAVEPMATQLELRFCCDED